MHESIINWAKLLGSSSWRFNNKMLNNLDVWEDIQKDDLKEIIELSKGCMFCHYAIIPFFIKYVGVNIGSLYPKIMIQDKWTLDEILEVLDILSVEHNSLHQSNSLESLGFEEKRVRLNEIRTRLINDGIHGILKIKISNEDNWFFFDNSTDNNL